MAEILYASAMTTIDTETHLSDVRYDSLALDDALQASIKATGFEYCTPIQAQSLPITLQGKDIAGQAQTGTGKSAAFLIATFQYLLSNPAPAERQINQPRAVMLAPTRELAMQIHKDALQLSSELDITVGLVYGGANYDKQRKMLEAGVDVLIGTPGRLIDYFKQKVFNLKQCQVVVLDEADRMFDLGFIADVRYVIRRCPEPSKRLSMLFSATLSHRVQELAYEHMNNPELVKVEAETVTGERIEQRLYHPANDEKIPLLIGLFQNLKPSRSIVFVNTKRNADIVWGYLQGNGIETALLSGDVPQHKRSRMMQEFQDGKLQALVATDVASRGLHVTGVTHVFNYDLPQSGEDYTHRIGRTARAGAEGTAISFACEDTAFNLMDIEQYTGASIPNAAITNELIVEPAPAIKRERKQGSGSKPSRRGGQRRSKPSSGGHKSDGNRSQQSKPNHGNQDGNAGNKDAKTGDQPNRRRRRRRSNPNRSNDNNPNVS